MDPIVCAKPDRASSLDDATVLELAAKTGRLTALEIFLSEINTEYLNTPFISGQIAPLLAYANKKLSNDASHLHKTLILNKYGFTDDGMIALLKRHKFNFNQPMLVMHCSQYFGLCLRTPLAYYMDHAFQTNRTGQSEEDEAITASKLENIKLLLAAGAKPFTRFEDNFDETVGKRSSSSPYEYADHFPLKAAIKTILIGHTPETQEICKIS